MEDLDPLLRDAFGALTTFDSEALVALCDEDVSIKPMRAAFEDTVYRGHEGVTRFIEDARETWAELRAEVHEIEADGDRVLVLGALRGRSVSGLPLDVELGWVVRILEGKILKVRTHLDRDAARRDFRG